MRELIRSSIDGARAALQRGDYEQAIAWSRRALALDQRCAPAWVTLGTALRHTDPASAEDALRRAISCDARSADAHFHLGNLLREAGRHADAVDSYRQALRLAPGHPSLLNNLGLAQLANGDEAGAERSYRSVLASRPGHPQALRNLVHLLCRRQRNGEALALAREYLRHTQDAPADFWLDVGICQHRTSDFEGAVASLKRAAALAPDDPVVQLDLGSALVDLGDYPSAERLLQRVVAGSPENLTALSLLGLCRQHLCRWEGLAALHEAIRSAVAQPDAPGVNPLFALAMPLSPELQQRVARRWAAEVSAPQLPASAPRIRSRGDRLRLGYVSSDFRVHAMAFLATEVWERHDATRIDTFAYAIGPADDSALRARIRRAFGSFHDCHAIDDAGVVQSIRDDGIDVLIDLNGYTTHARSEILAARPARLQMQWLGFLGTMGAPWIDCIITDNFATPPALQAHFDERLLALPDCYCPSDTRRDIAPTPSRAACGLPEKGFVFCCFNNPYKLLPDIFATWMRILHATPGSLLWLSPSSPLAEAHLRREAHARGIDPSRLVVAPHVPVAEHLARLRHADLYLDTLPYNAGTTANDALFVGVPVLTCPGSTMASRVAGSQVHTLGMESLIAANLDDYAERAIRLATDAAAFATLREELADRRATSPLFDMARFTVNFEAALLAAAGAAGNAAAQV